MNILNKMASGARAFAPANISCIFKIFQHNNPRWMGSYGVGFTLDEGVIAEASAAKRNEIVFNNRPIIFPTISSLIKKLTDKKIKISISSSLPLGCGFGLSGASASPLINLFFLMPGKAESLRSVKTCRPFFVQTHDKFLRLHDCRHAFGCRKNYGDVCARFAGKAQGIDRPAV